MFFLFIVSEKVEKSFIATTELMPLLLMLLRSRAALVSNLEVPSDLFFLPS